MAAVLVVVSSYLSTGQSHRLKLEVRTGAGGAGLEGGLCVTVTRATQAKGEQGSSPH